MTLSGSFISPALISGNVGLIALLMATASQANDADAKQNHTSISHLPEIIVEASSASDTATGPINGYVAKQTLTGAKTQTTLIEIPQSVSIIGVHEIEDRGASSVMDALRYVPGVATETYGALLRGQDDFLQLRGFTGLGTSLYLDGLRMNTDGNNFSNQRNEVYGLERIEVLRGPASVLYGKGDVGGVINRVSKRPQTTDHGEIEAKWGAPNRRHIAADIGGPLDKDKTFLYRLIGVSTDADTQIKYPDGSVINDRRYYFAPSLTWKPTARTSVTALAETMQDRNKGYSFLYRPVDNGTRRSDFTLLGDPKFTGLDSKQMSLGYVLGHSFNDDWQLSQNMRYSKVDIAYRRVKGGLLSEDAQSVTRVARVFNQENNQTVIDTHIEGRLKTGSVMHKLLFGFDFERQNTSDLTAKGLIGDLNLLNPIYGQTAFVSSTADANNSRQRLGQLGIYAQEQLRLTPRWLFTVGGRIDRATIRTVDHMTGTDWRQTDNNFSGRIGVNYTLRTGLVPYFSYSESFLPVAGRDAAGKPFKPSEGKQYEAGVKYSPANSRSLFTAAIFDLRKTNVLTTDLNDSEYSTQTGGVRSQGVELEIKKKSHEA
ncbi:TonB-dependent siderophore receptor [Pigmentiphaga litoralis]|uniref:TonB-dependent siderophore receptor n=1 Tax=Pigmentiphaga litoralis TaxID=516702 RepID=UPI003B432130